MKMKNVEATPMDDAFHKEFLLLLRKHLAQSSAERLLAVASHAVGQLIALQDQRVTNPERALEIVRTNMEMGNAATVAFVNDVKGNA